MSDSDQIQAEFDQSAPYLLFIADGRPDPHEIMIECIGRIDRSTLIVWCSRLNLLRSIYGSSDIFDRLLSPTFFDNNQILRMRSLLKRAHRPRGIFLTCFRRKMLLEVLRWAALVGKEAHSERPDLTRNEASHLIRAAHCANSASFRHALEALAGPVLGKEKTPDVVASYSLPMFAQISAAMEHIMRKDRQILGRSAMMLCDGFFAENPEWKHRFEALVAMPVEAWLGCVIMAQRITTGDLRPKPETSLLDFGIADASRAEGMSERGRSLLAAFLEQQCQDVDELHNGLLARLADKAISPATPFDITSLRRRPFIRTRFKSMVLSDRWFLEDKLWVGPVFRLLEDGVSASLLFGKLGDAVERYVIRLIESASKRTSGTGEVVVYANPKSGGLELTDVCIRTGRFLVMIECKTAWLPEEAKWEYGDAAFIKAVRSRLAGIGKSKAGVGQLARSIVGLAEATLVPDDADLLAGVKTILPVILVQDTSFATVGMPAFLAKEFAAAVRHLANNALDKPGGIVQIGNIQTALPTMMTISDIELFESMLAKLSIADYITSYSDPDRLIPAHILIEGAIAASPHIQLDPSSLIAVEGAALWKRALGAVGVEH